MVSFHRLATLWHLTLATSTYATSESSFILNVTKPQFLCLWCSVRLIFNSLVFIRFEKLEGKEFSINDADYFVFHSPYNKVISQSFNNSLCSS